MAATELVKNIVAPLTLTEIDPSGTGGASANADGNFIEAGPNTLFTAKVTSGSTPVVATLHPPAGGSPQLVNKDFDIPATGNYTYGAMLDPIYADEDGLFNITYDGVTNLKVAAFELPNE